MSQIRICLWSSPRNISTALMYSFAQREDTCVIDEPLYAHYLKKTDADHPGREEVISSMQDDGERVVNDVIFGQYEKDVIFFKMMAHHLIDIDESFLDKMTNVFLIRHPKLLISSLARVIKNVTMRDTGIKKQSEMFQMLSEKGRKPVVIDSAEVLSDPEIAIMKLCNAIEIPYDSKILNWKSGPIKEDGIWAQYWYGNVHQSTGFEKNLNAERELPPGLLPLYEKCLPYYNQLSEYSIRADR